MRKRKWLCLVLILACLVVFLGYRTVARMNSDTKAPQIDMDAQLLQVSVQDPASALLQGVTAKDDSDGDVTGSLVVESIRLVDSKGTANVSYAAFDSSGNVAKAERQIQYTDYESPRFSLDTPLVFTANSSFDVLSIITVHDAIDGDISHRIRATSLDEDSIATVGTHDVQFRVTNSLGDTVELVLPVEVYTARTYEATLKLTDYLIYLDAGSVFDEEDYLDSYSLSGNTVSLRGSMPKNYTVKTSGTVDTRTPGVYSVDYKVTYTKVNEADSSYNQSYTGYSKLIVVVEG